MSRAAEAQRTERQVVPDDAPLNAMGFGELTTLAVRCKLPGGCLCNEKSAREGLRRFREETAGRQRDARAVDVIEEQRQ